MISDIMAKRPRLDLLSLHFEDSYKAEIECLQLQTRFMRDVIRMQMKEEFAANNFIREYLEKTFRIVMASQEGNWTYTKPQN
jgi:hypothetical protein